MSKATEQEAKLREDSRYKDKATLEIMDLCMGAADTIERLESENAALRERLAEKSNLIRQQAREMERRDEIIRRQEKELDSVTAERDAALAYLRKSNWCAGCINFCGLGGCKDSLLEVCDKDHDHYQFRGIQKEDGGNEP